ncbi:protein AHNAK2 isoform X2 [Castor canadensis]|uniref:Protein AHNAK2 isoform X2 n=1 Tax=Castor canadensis TaxID=51338 RepID=A0AC58M150_CASCN
MGPAVSGRQLQPEGPDAETEENHSVTEGPTDEIIRPRPQGSSPVYEYTAEGAGFGVQENVPGRRTSGRRRSWWKRHSGDSPAFSSMSNSEAVQEATEVTLKTEVEAGATGYSVTGGGDQGIFVKQVLKDSPADTLFSLREGDQLLSTTIFFDDIKYEDAFKILQYSEPYKVQFKIKRKLPASKEDEWAALYPQQVSKGKEKKQDKDVADGCTETPTKSVEADGDRERLISKSRVGRSRRPQDRLSWPKFQAIRSRRGARPRRSHSSSEAYEQADTSDVSPTNTDTEAQQPAEHWEQKAMQGSQRKRFLNLRFRMGLGQDRSTAQQPGGQAQDVPAEVLEHVESWDDEQQDIKTAEGGRSEERTLMTEAIPALTTQLSMEPGILILGEGDSREGESRVDRRKRKTEQAKTQEKAKTHTEPGTQSTLRTSWKDEQDGVESLEMGIARLSLQDKSEEGSPQRYPPDTQVRIRHLKTPKFGFAKENMLESERRAATTELAQKQLKDSRVKTAQETDRERDTGAGDSEPKKHMLGQEDRRTQRDTAQKGQEHTQEEEEEIEKQRGQVRTKIPKLKMPTFGWSPSKERQQSKEKTAQVYESERIEQETLGNVRTQTHSKDGEGRTRKKTEETTKILQKQKDSMTKEMTITMGGMEDATKEDKFKMPKLSTPSLGVLAPGKSMEASLEVLAPKVQEDISQPSIPGDHKTKDFSFELPSADLEVKAGQVNVKIQEGQLPEGELEGQAAGESLKGLLPKVQMPSLKIPTVDIKGTKEDQKGTKGEDSTPNVDVPSLEVDIQAPGAKLEGNLALADKDMAAKDSKFKMPKFKMPSFGVSKPGKGMETSLEVSAPKVKADVALPSIQSDLKTTDISVEFPSTDLVVEAGKVDVKLPEGQLPKREMAGQAAGTTLKDHLPKVHQSIKMPKVDLKGPQVEIKGPNVVMKGPKGKVNKPELDVPSLEMDVQAPGARLEGDLAMEDKDLAAKDSKFKMPKFKMPSFGVSAPGKSMEASMEVSAPKVQADVALPSIQGDLKITDTRVELPSADLEFKTGQEDVKLPEGQRPEGELTSQAAGAGLKGHLPKVQMPSLKTPKVDIKGPKLDVKGPKGKVSASERDMSSLDVDIQVPGDNLKGDLAQADKDMATKDRKFKMPKFKMPSFGVLAPGKDMEASLEVSAQKVQADVVLPSIQGDLKITDTSVELPSAELEVKDGQVDVRLPEGQLPQGELAEHTAGKDLKGHLPKLQILGLKMPKVEIKGPQVDIKGSKVDMNSPKGKVSTPELEVDIQAPRAKPQMDQALADKDMAAKDSKFKRPKFKMPSFGVPAPGKDLEASLEISAPMIQADVALPSIQGDLKITDTSVELPSADLEVQDSQVDMRLPEGQLPQGELAEHAAGAGLKGHLPKLQIPGIKMPKVEIMGPQVDIKGSKVDMKSPKGKVITPELEVDIQAPGAKLEMDQALAEKDVATKDSKFKMPKFKMPSFGVPAPGKTMEALLDVSAPKIQEDVPLPSIQAELKTTDVSLELPSAGLDIKTGQEDVKLPEGQLPEGELVGQATGAGLKGHLPKVQMPSLKISKVDLKGPQVDIKGPKVDIKGSKVDMKGPTGEVSTPKLEVDIQAPRAKLEGDLALAEKDLAAKDSKFKMPKFKMPSFGVSAPGKGMEASVEVSAPKIQEDVPLPSIQAKLKSTDVSLELPSAELDIKTGQEDVKFLEGELPEGELVGQATGAELKGHLPKVQMPSLKMPQVDLKGPQVDIKGPKVDMKGPKGDVSTSELDMPSLEVDFQAPGAKLEGDLALAEKDLAAKDSKFKMPKFKMPSFGVSAPGKGMEASVEVSAPKIQEDVPLPSIQAELKTTDVSLELPSAELKIKTGQEDVKFLEGELPEGELVGQATGAELKGHLPKVQMPSLKMPQVDLKGPQVDIKGPKVDMKGPKGEVSTSELDMPSLEVDFQAPGAKLEGDLALAEKDLAAKDSKFKMPKFKMPSFRVSAPGKGTEASVEVSAPKIQEDVPLPSIQAELKTTDVSLELPSAELKIKTGQEDVKFLEGELPEGELVGQATGAELKGHLPKVQMPSLKMPQVDLKGPQVDIKGPKVDMKGPKGEVSTSELDMPSLEVDFQAPGAKLEGDLALAEKDLAAKDSKFKMPKFKMPSFGLSAPGKGTEASLKVSDPKVQTDVALPLIQCDLQTTDVTVEQPPADLEFKAGQLDVKLPERQLPEGEPVGQATGVGLKGHLPKVQMPSLKISKVDLKGPNVDTKGPKVDVKGPKGDVSTSDLDMPSLEVDIKAPGAKLERDLALADKDMTSRDSKFKMPKFKMPSFGVSAPGKDTEASLEVSAPKVQADVALPSILGDIETTDFSVEFPSADLEFKACQLDVRIQEGQKHKGELEGKAAGASHKGHLHKVQMPSMKMTKVDLKGPQMEGKGPKGEVSTSELDMPSLEVDIKAPGAKLEGDLSPADKDMAAKDSKFKMPKFKMPSFGVSAPGKSMEASVEVSAPKIQEDVPLPSIQAELKTTDVSLELPSAELDIKTGQEDVKFLEGQLLEGELVGQATGSGLKDHLPKVQMTSPKMPKVGLKGPQVDIKGPKVDIKGSKVDMKGPTGEVSTPKLEVDIQAPRAKLEGDLALADKDMAAKDSKFKMPKFKMPSFGVSAPGKGMEASVEVSAPKIQEDVPLPSIQAELKTTDVSLELPSAELKIKTGQEDVKFLEGELPEGELVGQATGAELKGHLPKVQMPSLKMPQVDLKGPQVDIKGPKVDMKGPKGEVSTSELDMPSLEVDFQAPGAKLEGDLALAEKDLAAKDSKFKMPKFKMPSFRVSAPGKGTEASVEVSAPKIQEDVPLPSIQAELKTTDVSLELPSAELEIKTGQDDVKFPESELPEGELVGQATGADLKVHLPKMQMPSLKMPQGDLKGPQVDIKGPKLDIQEFKVDMKGPTGEVSTPELEVDVQAPRAKLEMDQALTEKDVATKDSKFKMPKFKMPSFGLSAPGKGTEASLKVSDPKVQTDVALPLIQCDLQITDVTVEQPPADLEFKAGQLDVKLPERQLPEGEPVGQATGVGLKGHLPKVQMPSLKMPQVDLSGPQVDIKGPKVDVKGPKGDVSTSDLDMPSLEVDIKAPGAKLERDLALADKDMTSRDSKFKMPKFKMPSFGMSAPGKDTEASLKVSVPKVQEDVALPSFQGDLKITDTSVELPSAELEFKTGQEEVKLPQGQLPEGEVVGQAAGAGLKGHLPKMQMPGLKMPKVELKGPQGDIKGSKVDVKGPKDDVSAYVLDMPNLVVDIQAPGARLEGDLALADKDVAAKDSKFKMPKFKMPSFGVSAPGKDMEASLEVSAIKVQADVALSSIQGDLKITDTSVELPSAELEFKTGQEDVKLLQGQLPEGELVGQATGAELKGHLPKVQMPSLKMPQVDLKGPQVDIKGPKVDMKGPKGDVSTSELDMPSLEVDFQAPGAKLEGDLALAEKDLGAKDSKFKMPKFKMPSFGVSAPGKGMEASVEVSAPKIQEDVPLPSIQAELKTTDVSLELPSAELEIKTGQDDIKFLEGELLEGELVGQATGAGLKDLLPKVQTPSLKMPKVDLKGPQVDIKGPKVDIKGSKVDMKGPTGDVSTPELEVDVQAPGAKLETNQALAEKDVAAKDSKFKMPKFKMPSFGVSAPGKGTEASLKVSASKVQTDVALPLIQGDLQTTDVTIEQPSADLEFKAGQLDVKLLEGQLPKCELVGQATGAGLKDHLPKVQMHRFEMPKVDLEGPKLDVKGPKGDVSTSELDVPSLEVDIQAPTAKLEMDQAMADKDMAAKDSKFKMPSFGVSAPDKSMEALLEVSTPKVQADVALPSIQGKLKTTDVSLELPSAELEIKTGQEDVKLPEGQLPEGELVGQATGAGQKGHLPNVQMPGLKMSKVDLKGPQVDIKGPKMDMKCPKGDVSTFDLKMPSLEVDIQAPGAKLKEDLAPAEKDLATKDSKFKMPKFKMPSFGVSAPGKDTETSLEVSAPKVQADVALSSIQGDLKTTDVSMELPSAELEFKAGYVDVKLPEGQLPEGELTGQAAGAGLKDLLPKLQIPSLKMPKVDIKGPQVDLKGPQVDIKGSKVDMKGPTGKVSTPELDVDIQAPRAKLEMDQAVAEKDVAAKDSKFKRPKFKMPSFGVSTPGKGMEASLASKVQTDVALNLIQGDLQTTDVTVEQPSADLEFKAGQLDVKLLEGQLPEAELVGQATGAGLKGHPPKVQIPTLKIPKVDLKGPQVDIKDSRVDVKGPKGEVSAPQVVMPSLEMDIQAPGAKLDGDLGPADKDVVFKDSKFKMPKFKMPSFGLSTSGKSSEPCVLSGYKVTSVPSFPPSSLDSPLSSECFAEPHCLSDASSAVFDSSVHVCTSDILPASSRDSQSSPIHPVPPSFHFRVTFPKFHKPKFAFEAPSTSVSNLDSGIADHDVVLSPVSPGQVQDSSGERIKVPLLSCSQDMSTDVPVYQSMEEHSSQSGAGATAALPDQDGKGSPFKLSHFQLPSFSLSPKKEVELTVVPEYHLEDPTLSVVLSSDQMDSQTTGHVSQLEAHPDLLTDKEGEKGKSKKPGFTMPRLALPKLKPSKGWTILPQGDVETLHPVGGDSEASESESSGGVGEGTGTKEGPLEGEHINLQLPQVCIPSLDFAKPGLTASMAKVEVSQCKADLPLPKHDPAVTGGSKGVGLEGDSASQSCGEGTAPTTDDPLQPSCRQPDDVPTMERPEEDATVGDMPADSHGRWFKMPKFYLPGFRRSSSKDQDGARDQEATQMHMSAATAPAKTDATAREQVSHVPGSQVEAGADVTASESTMYTDVLRHDPHSTDLKLHLPTARMSQMDLPTSEIRIQPAEGSLSIQMPGVRWSEPQVPPEGVGKWLQPETEGHDLAKVEKRTETWSSQPEGPLKLKASSADVPSQISIVNTGQLWEDSVLKVTFPKLNVPRFSFPAPSSEDDIFFPVVRKVQDAEASVHTALCQDGPGLWGASLLKTGAEDTREQPASPDLPLEASPVSKVRVHIQGAQGKSQEVIIRSRVTQEYADLAVPEAFSTQIVRESEIPVSTIQTPSYGFSLLKVKVPEPSMPASVCTVALDSGALEGLGEAPTPTIPGADLLPGDLQSEATEPFEMISASVNLPGLQTFTSEVRSGPQLADSGSDEEPAEILEFPDDSQEVKTSLSDEDRAPKEKPESKKSSGLLWSWLPSIGFSSVDETSSDSRDDARRSAPIQTQPMAQPDTEQPKKQERAGWFRFPKLGFSSPTKKSKSSEDEADLAEQRLQEEVVTFFDARESLSPEEDEDCERAAGAAGSRQESRVMVTSPARTELVLQEQGKNAGDDSAPRPMAK